MLEHGDHACCMTSTFQRFLWNGHPSVTNSGSRVARWQRQDIGFQATAIDAAVASGETLGPLAGVPIAVKDNICTKGVPTTAASQILQGYLPPYNATVISRLQAAGAVIIGKTNMDEFGMGSTTENSAYHITRNAWSSEHVPGVSL